MALELNPTILVNILAFVGLTVATYTIFWFGRMMNASKEISISLFTLAMGINLIGISHLLRIWLDANTSPLILVTIAVGSALMSTGVIWVFSEKSSEITRLEKREDEIKSVIARLKDKYYDRELSEADLKGAYSELMKELIEIEVRLANRTNKS